MHLLQPLQSMGGSKNKDVDGDVSIEVQGVSTSTIYGGGYSDGTASANVNGNVVIRVRGTANAGGSIYGGGYAYSAKGNASANVSGDITIDIPATPSGNHGWIYGGGNAVALSGNSASATAGSVALYATGRTYMVRGGGIASVLNTSSGNACADVYGAISLWLNAVDVREVYCGGRASGTGAASASVGSVESVIQSSEIMIFEGGGEAIDGATSQVIKNVTARFVDCPNVYGYVRGGGSALASSSGLPGACADVLGSVNLNMQNCDFPIANQWGEPVAATVNAGGYASGAGTTARVNGDSHLVVTGGENAGQMYGGGEFSRGGDASVSHAAVTLSGISGTESKDFPGTRFSATVGAGAAIDSISASYTAVQSASITVSSCELEDVRGGDTLTSAPYSAISCSTPSNLVVGAGVSVKALSHFDTITLSMNPVETLNLESFAPKAVDRSTELICAQTSGKAQLVACSDVASEEQAKSWFTLRNGTLDYKGADDSTVLTWSVGKRTVDDGVVEVAPPAEGMPRVDAAIPQGLLNSLLTEADKKDLEDGISIGFSLAVTSPTNLAPEVKTALEQAKAASRKTSVIDLDINLMKTKSGVEDKISTLPQNAGITLAIQIPKDALDVVSENEVFSILRSHVADDGSVSVDELKDTDSDPSTITVTTDKFSVYSLVFGAKAADPIDPPTPPDPVDPPDPDDPSDPTNPPDPDDPNNPSDPVDPPDPDDPKDPGDTGIPGESDGLGQGPETPGSPDLQTDNQSTQAGITKVWSLVATGDSLTALWVGVLVVVGGVLVLAAARIHALRRRRKA